MRAAGTDPPPIGDTGDKPLIFISEAARRAQQAGMTVVVNRCPAIEYARLF